MYNSVSGWGRRHQQCLILFFSLTTALSMRSCMGVALVAMAETKIETLEINNIVNNTNINLNATEKHRANETKLDGIYDDMVLNSTTADSTNPPKKYVTNHTKVNDTNDNLLVNSSVVVDFTNVTDLGSLVNGGSSEAKMQGNATKGTFETVLHALLLVPPVSISLHNNNNNIIFHSYCVFFNFLIEENNKQDCLTKISQFEREQSLDCVKIIFFH